MWTAAKVFSATKARERDRLGDVVTDWVRREKPQIVDTVIRQSSDNEFHCLSILVFYNPSGSK